MLGESLRVEDLTPTGLFEAVVSHEDFEGTVQRLVQQLGQMAPGALKATKQSLNEIAAGLYAEPVLRERSRHSVHSEDFAEGRAAFAQRRAPRFRGR